MPVMTKSCGAVQSSAQCAALEEPQNPTSTITQTNLVRFKGVHDCDAGIAARSQKLLRPWNALLQGMWTLGKMVTRCGGLKHHCGNRAMNKSQLIAGSQLPKSAVMW